uniref:Sulfotransferase domain-containing protein n=1 Tax=Haptolina brevifila TaxID=156173 RepID=A0A7S2I1A3_9EUKA
MPMRANPLWFRTTFLEKTAPERLDVTDDIWPFIRGFNEYDGLTTVVAATAMLPHLFNLFFQPFKCAATDTKVIGISPEDAGIVDPEKASELLHDLMAMAFYTPRFRKGFKIEIRTSPLAESWQLALLDEPTRGQGADSWKAVVTEGPEKYSGTQCTIPVYLSRSTEGILWRLSHKLGDRERILSDVRLGLRYRKVQGVRAYPFTITQSTWEYLRKGFEVRPGDVWATGYPCAGNTLIQMVVRTLRVGGDCDAVTQHGPQAMYASGISSTLEMDVSRGKVDLAYLSKLPESCRVFTSYHTPENMPCMPTAPVEGGDRPARLLPAGIKVVHLIRDPRDSCASLFGHTVNDTGCEWDLWVESFIEGSSMPWGGWLKQNLAWWAAHQRHPDQVLWLTFEEFKEQPQKAVRRVADFLGCELSESDLEELAKATEFEPMKRRLEGLPKLRSGGMTGQLKLFSKPQLHSFDVSVIQPALAVGMRFRDTGADPTMADDAKADDAKADDTKGSV